MAVVLGIDTGGTYTDAVIVNQKNSKILSNEFIYRCLLRPLPNSGEFKFIRHRPK